MRIKFQKIQNNELFKKISLAGKDCFTDLYSEILASIFQTLFLHTVVGNIVHALM